MLNKILGKKVGMTQLFDEGGKSIPVTVVNISNWIVAQVKTSQADGYSALQVGLIRKRYRSKDFSQDWLKAKAKYFLHLKEIIVEGEAENYTLGQPYAFDNVSIEAGDKVVVTGLSRGLGFQGVVKRWGFGGGPSSHGSTSHRIPGSIGNMTSQGEVVKGKKMPGQMGNKQVTVKGLKVVRIDRESGCLFIKGAVPGKQNTLVAIKK